MSEQSSAMVRYQHSIQELLQTAFAEEREAISRAGALVVRSFSAGGLLYIFGSGHSHVFAEEAFYRAGGAARVCPVLKPAFMLHEGAVQSTVLERQSGHADELLAGYRLDGSRDCMLVASNSGVNALPIEVASTARDLGLPVIAITSLGYSRSIEGAGRRLFEVADVVIDNHCPPGDALIELGCGLPMSGPGSTVVGLALLNSIIVNALERQRASGREPDVFMSANMPGAREHNERVLGQLTGDVPHL